MKRRYRKAALVLVVGLAGLLAYAGYSAQVQASHGSSSASGGYGKPQSYGGESGMAAGMTMSGPAQSSRTVVLKHRRIVHVSIQNLTFGPQRIVVSAGTKIIWTNQDAFQHTTTSDRGAWDSGPMNKGAQFGRVFKKLGTFTYHCTIHPFMHGTITVSN